MKRTDEIRTRFLEQNPKLFCAIIEVDEISAMSSTDSGDVRYDPPILRITVKHQFIFDNREVPKFYEGIEVRNMTIGDFPQPYFPSSNISLPLEEWYAPERYKKFVDDNSDLIRRKLHDQNMTKDAMLDALTFEGSFVKHKAWCSKLRKGRNT